MPDCDLTQATAWHIPWSCHKVVAFKGAANYQFWLQVFGGTRAIWLAVQTNLCNHCQGVEKEWVQGIERDREYQQDRWYVGPLKNKKSTKGIAEQIPGQEQWDMDDEWAGEVWDTCGKFQQWTAEFCPL
jgi:hypothetical protein